MNKYLASGKRPSRVSPVYDQPPFNIFFFLNFSLPDKHKKTQDTSRLEGYKKQYYKFFLEEAIS